MKGAIEFARFLKYIDKCLAVPSETITPSCLQIEMNNCSNINFYPYLVLTDVVLVFVIFCKAHIYD